MRVLAIETSCDETAVAIYDSQLGLLAHQLYSQAALHAEYGGVVPELASRDHIRKCVPLAEAALAQANISRVSINAIAATVGPGLVGALLVGAGFARSLAYAWAVPFVPVHHMEAHLLAPMLEENPPKFPFLALLISGGHTLLVAVDGLGNYRLLGETLDDSVGEAFDKTAKLLGLDYPGGPALEKLAANGCGKAYTFPRPMTDRPGLDFSFSGLKTFVLNTWKRSAQDDATRANIACAFQQAAVDTLAIKCRRALKQTHLPRLVVAGGVSANQYLRQELNTLGKALNVPLYYPRPEFCTDNAAMVAYTGAINASQGKYKKDLTIQAKARWPLC